MGVEQAKGGKLDLPGWPPGRLSALPLLSTTSPHHSSTRDPSGTLLALDRHPYHSIKPVNSPEIMQKSQNSPRA